MPNVDVRAGSTFAPARYSELLPNFDVRTGSTFAPARSSGHLPNVDARACSTFAQLDIRDFCRMSISELSRHSSQLDIQGLLPNVDVRAGSTFAPARYSGLLPNVDVRTGSTFAPARYSFFCRMSLSELARHSSQLDIRMSNVDCRCQCQLHAPFSFHLYCTSI
ncbi:hypothetical protein DPMN_013332 [Dreissena polymorpha]|uniref:Uncharacterized protein n=1 Tax=Dreissena polymorpha TaxID=45954 RepID=A0A9D4N8T5_DREPO|nr:hypothetical protein DPMN_013332 [Dreissena polymorpha]